MIPSPMPAATGGRLRRGELIVELPLQPAVKVDVRRRARSANSATARALRMLQLVGPLVPVAAVLLGQRAPGREVVEAAALPLAVGVVRQVPARGSLDAVHRFQRGALDLPHGVPVDQS